MTTYAVDAANGERGAHGKTLVASTVDTVTFNNWVDEVEVVSDGAAALFVRVDGNNPTVNGAFSYVLPAGSPSVRTIRLRKASPSIGLISAGTPTYSVTKL